MKIRMSRSYKTYVVYDTIEINKDEYPELEGMSDEEALEYLEDNLHEFEVKDGYEGSLANEFEFGKDMVKEKQYDDEYELHLIEE